MRILDQDNNCAVNYVTLYLTLAEAKELRDSLDDLIAKPDINHAHIPSEDYKKEITVTVYGEGGLEQFDERSLKLILEDN